MGEWDPVSLADAVGANGSLIGGPFGSALGRKDYLADGVPVVRGANLRTHVANFEDAVFVSDQKADSLTRCLARPGDIAVTQRGTLGQVARLNSEFPRYLISQSQMAVSVDGSVVLPEFLLLAMRTPAFHRQITDEAIATGVPHLNLGILGRLQVPRPSLAEQRAIAEVLGALDDKIESDRRAAIASDAAWVHQAGRLMADSEPVGVGELVTRQVLGVDDGFRAKNDQLGREGPVFLRAGNLTGVGLSLEGADRVQPGIVDPASPKCARPWDTAFTSKGTVGRFTLVTPETEACVYSPQVCVWRSLDERLLSPLFLHAWMLGPRFRAQVDAVKGQTDMADYVSLRDQRAMLFDLPPEQVQHEFTHFADPLARHAAAMRKESRTLAALRDALLPKLVSGKIRVPLSGDVDEQIGAATEALGA